MSAVRSAVINRVLTDKERSLLLALTTRVLADQASCSHDEAAAVLSRIAAERKLVIEGNAEQVCVKANGGMLVVTARDWLAFHAEFPGNDPMRDEVRQ